MNLASGSIFEQYEPWTEAQHTLRWTWVCCAAILWNSNLRFLHAMHGQRRKRRKRHVCILYPPPPSPLPSSIQKQLLVKVNGNSTSMQKILQLRAYKFARLAVTSHYWPVGNLTTMWSELGRYWTKYFVQYWRYVCLRLYWINTREQTTRRWT